MDERTASKVLLLVVVLMLLLAASSTRRFTTRPRALSVADRIVDWTPWLAQHGPSRFGVHALGALVGLGALVDTDFHASAPSLTWVAILVVLGIVDVAGGLLASVVWIVGLAATGNLGSMLEVRIAILVAALGMLPIVTAELVRPGAGRSRSNVTASQLFVVAALTATMSAGLLALLNATTGLSFAAASAMGEVAVVAILASIARLALTARLAPEALRHPRRCAPHFFAAVGVVIAVSLTPTTASASTIVGVAVFAAVVAAMTVQTRLGFAPRLVSSASMAMVAVLVVAGGVVSFGSSDVREIPLEVDAVEVDQMTIIGQTSAFVDGIPHVFVAGSVKEGEVVYANGALGMTLTITSRRHADSSDEGQPDHPRAQPQGRDQRNRLCARSGRQCLVVLRSRPRRQHDDEFSWRGARVLRRAGQDRRRLAHPADQAHVGRRQDRQLRHSGARGE